MFLCKRKLFSKISSLLYSLGLMIEISPVRKIFKLTLSEVIYIVGLCVNFGGIKLINVIKIFPVS